MLTLVTGAGGFVGSYLCEELRRQKSRVIALSHRDLDVTQTADVEKAIQEHRPVEIFHLAAQSSASRSWTESSLTYDVNVGGTHNLLDAVRRHSPHARILITSTSDVYGAADGPPSGIVEEERPRPLSPYAASKLGQESVATMFQEAFRLQVVITRSFMHVGPRRPASFATADWARQIALAEQGFAAPILRVGDTEVVREFNDVRDIVRAYIKLMRADNAASFYNVASGNGYPLKRVVDMLQNLATIELDVRADPTRIRSADPRVLVGNPRKLRELTGWVPTYSLEESVTDILEYWRREVSS